MDGVLEGIEKLVSEYTFITYTKKIICPRSGASHYQAKLKKCIICVAMIQTAWKDNNRTDIQYLKVKMEFNQTIVK